MKPEHRLLIILQTEAELWNAIARHHRQSGKLTGSKDAQTMGAYWSERARKELFKVLKARPE
jgi:hypothetical protein